MPVTDNQLQFIFRYFDSDLSADEEQQLIQQLRQNKDMQAAFDQQVLMSRFTQEEKVTVSAMALESADDFLQRVAGDVQEKTKTQPAIVPVKKRDYRWLAAAAAIFIFLLAGILYYQSHKQPTANQVVKTPEKDTATFVKKTIALSDSNRLLADNDLYEKLYNTYYDPLPENTLKVPAAAQPYQDMYDRHKYKQLVAENEGNLGIKGQSNPVEENTVLLYFRFYKALAALATGKTAEAENGLKKVIASGTANVLLTNQANWYLLMVYLKKEDRKNSLLLAQTLSHKKQNPYQQKAITIEKVLSR